MKRETLETRKYAKNTEAKMNKGTDNKGTFFCLLPEELLLCIFEKVSDLKSLCRCSLVSKHFAKVVSGVRNVSITIPENDTTKSLQNRKKLLSQLRDSTVEQIPELLESLSLQHLNLTAFLQKLKELEYVHLEHEYPRNSDDLMFPMQIIKFASSSAELVCYVGLGARSIHKDTEDEPDHVLDSDSDVDFDLMGEGLVSFFLRCNRRYVEWMCIILILIKCHISLERVIISDPEMNRKLVIGEEQLVDIEETRLYDELVNHVSSHTFKFVWVPALHLPLSGRVLRSVTFGAINFPTPKPNASAMKSEESTFRDSDDKSKVFHEAVNEILKKHRDEITTCCFDPDLID